MTTTDIDPVVSKVILQAKLIRELSQLYEVMKYIETALLQNRLLTWGLHGLVYGIITPVALVEPN